MITFSRAKASKLADLVNCSISDHKATLSVILSVADIIQKKAALGNREIIFRRDDRNPHFRESWYYVIDPSVGDSYSLEIKDSEIESILKEFQRLKYTVQSGENRIRISWE